MGWIFAMRKFVYLLCCCGWQFYTLKNTFSFFGISSFIRASAKKVIVKYSFGTIIHYRETE